MLFNMPFEVWHCISFCMALSIVVQLDCADDDLNQGALDDGTEAGSFSVASGSKLKQKQPRMVV